MKVSEKKRKGRKRGGKRTRRANKKKERTNKHQTYIIHFRKFSVFLVTT